MRKSLFLLLFLNMFCLFSCRQAPGVQRQTIPLVREILSGSLPHESSILERSKSPRVSDAIYLIGDTGEVESFAGEFLNCDIFDNVDGSIGRDGLPDFAGETIVSLYDVANAPYQGYLDAGNEDFLRELNVRSALSALDTLCYISPYDRDGAGTKSEAKMIVLCSPYAAAYGAFDIDTLFRSSSCTIPVISPLDVAYGKVLQEKGSAAVIGVLAPRETVLSGVYSEVLKQKARSMGLPGAECVVFSASSPDPLTEFIDNYLSSGYTSPLDALIVDDASLDIASMEKSLSRITSVMSGESLTYGRAVSEDFKILSVRRLVCEECYSLMRRLNLFTHNIYYPKSEQCLTFPVPGLSDEYYREDGFLKDDFKYTRADESVRRTNMLLQYSGRYMPPRAAEDVQNQY